MSEKDEAFESRDDDKERGGGRSPGKGGDRQRGGGGGGFSRRKMCRFCADEGTLIDYKNLAMLKHFVTERGKLVPRRISGNCARHQRDLSLQVRRARMIALLPFSVTGK
ncbi:MAG TPA: 30S ribosomal protein S18 [Kofleriaceae bacterium]|nr:30S ribosomal protein S18 [Kofleriaceae bacterium]